MNPSVEGRANSLTVDGAHKPPFFATFFQWIAIFEVLASVLCPPLLDYLPKKNEVSEKKCKQVGVGSANDCSRSGNDFL